MISGLNTFITKGASTTLSLDHNPDLYVMEGQSNAAGTVATANLPGDIPSPITGCRIFTPTPSAWEDLTPGTNSRGTISTNANGDPEDITGSFGTETRLMRELQLLKGRTQYLVKYAMSASPLAITGSAVDWNSGHNGENYQNSNTKFTTALAGLVNKKPPRAYIWIQGENDANAGFAGSYQTNLQNFIAAKRSFYVSPNMPFIIVQLGAGQTSINSTHRTTVMNAQATVASQPYNQLVSTSGLTTYDGVHWDATSTNTLALRIFNALLLVP